MSIQDAEAYRQTGMLPATSETSVSPLESYSRNFGQGVRSGEVVVRIGVKPGTVEKLMDIGVRAEGMEGIPAFSALPKGSSGWTATSARFKLEATGQSINNGYGVINTGLGRGPALKIFNENIVSFEPLK